MLEARRTFFLPRTSDNEPAGRLIRTPGMVEAAATNPIKASGVPRLSAKGFRTGFLDIVELRIADAPMIHKTKKKYFSLVCLDTIFFLAISPSVKFLLHTISI
jgi:hypothetical protein